MSLSAVFSADLRHPVDLPEDRFGHREHLAVCWAYLEQRGLLETLALLPPRLRSLTRAVGQPDKYHHTITVAFVVWMAERMDGEPDLDTFLAANPDLLRGKELLAARWSDALLFSDEARRGLVPPDRA